MSLDSVLQGIHEQFERTHKRHATRPRTDAVKHAKLELSLAEKAAPILSRLAPMPSEHLRRDCVCYEIVEPNVENLKTLFEDALISLGFEPDASRPTGLTLRLPDVEQI